MLEELGVNPYTAPSIPMLIDELDLLKPIPYNIAKRAIPDTVPSDRPRLALQFGTLIADGFLLAVAERPDDAETLGRALLKSAQSLGVGQSVMKHGSSLAEMAARARWQDLRHELKAMQADVEAALIQLRDEEIAHLIALGGWIRGLEIYSKVIGKNYTTNRAAELLQPTVIDYFLDRLTTLSPAVREAAWAGLTIACLQSIRAIAGKPEGETLSPDEVETVHGLAEKMTGAIRGAGDHHPGGGGGGP